MENDTIAAVCSGMSVSGISVIRISGDDAFCVADRIFRSVSGRKVSEMRSYSVSYGHIFDDEKMIDEVLLIKMNAPKTYTRENVVEIDCHGGVVATRLVLKAVLNNGARLAEPGEFTKRAFINGRIDLSQAEAVMDVIHSSNELALNNSVKQLKGSVRDAIKSLRDRIISKTAYIEAALDDPEHISLDGFSDTLLDEITSVQTEIKKLISSFDNGRILKEGISTVILGRPNAGKSSLLNVFSGSDRAIVTDIAGTTRDTLEESVYLDGIVLNMTDTAGIRDTENIIEQIGVDKARKAAENADLILYVVDRNEGLLPEDEEIISSVSDKKVIVLVNKSDLDGTASEEAVSSAVRRITDAPVIFVSALEKSGIPKVRETILSMFLNGELDFDDRIYITNERHKGLLEKASAALDKVIESIGLSLPEDFYTIDMMDAYTQLGLICGENVEDDLADKIFSDFCMGK